MRKLIFIILISTPFIQILTQDHSTGNTFPYIDGLEAGFIAEVKAPSSMTNSVSSNYNLTDGYNYIIKFNVAFDNISSLDSIFSIVCYMPDYSVQKIKIIPDSLNYKSGNKASYSFLLSSKKTGWLKLILVQTEEINTQPDPDFYIKKSNRQSVYLGSPKN